ncbi:MAG: VCBS repeat-containing protein [Bacteroidetes bacterium]|nr:VCBS repeat-containing protein [Bacteroidota bacterium]
MKKRYLFIQFLLVLLINSTAFSFSVNSTIESVNPALNSTNVSKNSNISIVFKNEMNSSTINTSGFRVFGNFSGSIPFNVTYYPVTRTAVLDPVSDFKCGEKITVSVKRSVLTMNGYMTDSLYYSFTAEAESGHGNFYRFGIFNSGSGAVRSIIAGDIDNDNDIDLALLLTGINKIVLMKNDGSGNFGDSTDFILLNNQNFFNEIIFGDYDSDGDLDIASTTRNNSDVFSFTVYLNNGNGVFSLHSSINGLIGTYINNADINSDGYLDMISGIEGIFGVADINLALNNGNAVFSGGTLFNSYCSCPVYESFHTYLGILLNDYNNDGKVDMLKEGRADDYFIFNCHCFYLNLLSSIIPFPESYYDFPISNPNVLTDAGDLNGNGYIDFLINPDIIYLNDSSSFTQRNFPGQNGKYITGDFDGDGDIDIAEKNDVLNQIRLMLNNGSGNFTESGSVFVKSGGNGFAAADLDNDGDLDLAVSLDSAGMFSVLKNSECSSLTCSISGPENILTSESGVKYFSDIQNGFWTLSNYDNTQAYLVSDVNSDSVFVNAGNIPGHFVLYYNLNDSCGTGICNRHVYVDNPLPVELLSFDAFSSGGNVTLKWSTVYEINNAGFIVERNSFQSNGQSSWITAGFVKGSGTTTSPVNYLYDDLNLPSGIYEYRLKQTDYNGNYNYYFLQNKISIEIPLNFKLSQNYPNPFNPRTVINYELSNSCHTKLSVYDVLGNEVKILADENKNAGFYSVLFDGNGLASGIYFYSLFSNGRIIDTKRMLLVK